MEELEVIKVEIPPDNEGFVLIQCPRCGEFFKIHAADFNSDDLLRIYCPACGIASANYFTDDVIELAFTKAKNVAVDAIYRELKDLEFGGKNSLISLSIKKPKHDYEPRIHRKIDALETVHFQVCDREAKLPLHVILGGYYCPFCGVMQLEH